jgi:hypothetical protein
MTGADGAVPAGSMVAGRCAGYAAACPGLNVEVWLVTGSERFAAANRDAQEVCGQPEYSAVIRLS